MKNLKNFFPFFPGLVQYRPARPWQNNKERLELSNEQKQELDAKSKKRVSQRNTSIEFNAEIGAEEEEEEEEFDAAELQALAEKYMSEDQIPMKAMSRKKRKKSSY